MKKHTTWKNPSCFPRFQLTKEISNWLLYKESMTKQFKRECENQKKKFMIRIMREGQEIMTEHHPKQNDCKLFYTREVLISADDKILMYAKSFLPKNASSLIKAKFKGLQQKPLGEFLFSDKSVKRSHFKLTKIFPGAKEFNYLLPKSVECNFIWARKSHFTCKETFILLVEYFSPNLFSFMKGLPNR